MSRVILSIGYHDYLLSESLAGGEIGLLVSALKDAVRVNGRYENHKGTVYRPASDLYEIIVKMVDESRVEFQVDVPEKEGDPDVSGEEGDDVQA